MLVLGDSLSAAYGMRSDASWPRLLERRLDAAGHPHRVVNASISGETTAGGAGRIGDLLQRHDPAWVIVELGGNDGLRGIPPDVTEHNLLGIVRASREHGARVLLLGVRLPPNYGVQFVERFHGIYTRLATDFDVPLVPHLLEGVALEPGMMMADGIHPTADAQPRLLDNVWQALEPLLDPQAAP